MFFCFSCGSSCGGINCSSIIAGIEKRTNFYLSYLWDGRHSIQNAQYQHWDLGACRQVDTFLLSWLSIFLLNSQWHDCMIFYFLMVFVIHYSGKTSLVKALSTSLSTASLVSKWWWLTSPALDFLYTFRLLCVCSLWFVFGIRSIMYHTHHSLPSFGCVHFLCFLFCWYSTLLANPTLLLTG